jgi:hypothetical protein
MNEFENLILADRIKLDSSGYLTKEAIKIASHVVIPQSKMRRRYERGYKPVMPSSAMQSN